MRRNGVALRRPVSASFSLPDENRSAATKRTHRQQHNNGRTQRVAALSSPPQNTLHIFFFLLFYFTAFTRLGLFPVKMATGAGWQQPPYNTSTGSTKYTPSPTSSMFYDGTLTLDYTQDLHLKMSKKIAQLTKVCGCLSHAEQSRAEQGRCGCGWSSTVFTGLCCISKLGAKL